MWPFPTRLTRRKVCILHIGAEATGQWDVTWANLQLPLAMKDGWVPHIRDVIGNIRVYIGSTSSIEWIWINHTHHEFQFKGLYVKNTQRDHLYPSVEQALPRVIQLKWFPHLIIRNSLLLYLDFVLNDPETSSCCNIWYFWNVDDTITITLKQCQPWRPRISSSIQSDHHLPPGHKGSVALGPILSILRHLGYDVFMLTTYVYIPTSIT